MANTLTSVIPQIILQTLPVLRQNAVLPRLVWQNFGTEASERGRTIDIGITAAATTRDVAPAITPAANQDRTPTSASVTLDKWKESTHNLTDKEAREIMGGFLPKQGQECVKAVINTVESDILTAYLKCGNAAGTAGTTPFGSTSSLTAAATARRLLNSNLAPQEDRFVVLDPLAESNAMMTPEVFRFDGAGQEYTQINGNLGRRMGMNWFMDQNIVAHTVGTAWVTGWSLSTVSCSAGDTTVNVLNATASGTVLVGDLFTVAGSTQVYSIQTAVNATATTALVLTFFPALATAAATADAITVIATYMQNMIFQRQCIGFASRPLAPALGAASADSAQIVDPISGIALTLEITREHYQSTFRVSCLYGVNAVRKALGVHLLG